MKYVNGVAVNYSNNRAGEVSVDWKGEAKGDSTSGSVPVKKSSYGSDGRTLLPVAIFACFARKNNERRAPSPLLIRLGKPIIDHLSERKACLDTREFNSEA